MLVNCPPIGAPVRFVVGFPDRFLKRSAHPDSRRALSRVGRTGFARWSLMLAFTCGCSEVSPPESGATDLTDSGTGPVSPTGTQVVPHDVTPLGTDTGTPDVEPSGTESDVHTSDDPVQTDVGSDSSSAQPTTSSEQPTTTDTSDAASSSDDSSPQDVDGGVVSTSDDTTRGSESAGGDSTPYGEGFDVDVRLASEIDEQAPSTVGIVTWTVDALEVSDAYVEFGLTSDYDMQAPVDLSTSPHRALLLGMKPNQTYHFRVIASDGTTTYSSNSYTVDTGPVTDAVSIGSFEVLDATKREPGFTVASYWSGTGSAVAFVLDPDGEIVWAYDTGMTGGTARARLSEDGQHMWVITADNAGGALQRISVDGLSGETYAQTVGSHDITSVTGATMAYIDYGESDCDSIFEIDPAGTPREVWDSEERFGGSGSASAGAAVRCHGNALRYSAAEDVYTFSDVGTDIVVLNRAGEFQWSLAERVPNGVAAWGGRNHGHHLLDDSFVIFANSGGQAGASAVVEYTLLGEEVWRYDSGDRSANLGDVQRLPNGNTLVTFSNDSIVHEVTPDKELVLRWTGSPGTRIGYTLWRQSLYGASPDIHD